ncbi:unnamed protein product [Rotaria sordida]|uniref:EIF-4F 25 kDa subunit n=2 Tax=Rotaria sordida TaxID=392033 RepID=A0A815B050_9BILA|nr:unnamed protein product [Rotaria sordida]CAF1329913.1 unnamed protein product [Rotaria sordida]
MATNTINDGEIALENNDKIESSSPPPKDESSVIISDTPFHLLEGRWTFWYTHRPTTFRNSSINYDSCLKKLGTFGSIEEFWCYYDHMKFPSELPLYSDIHLFKENLKPMWEEEGNRLGGKWILRLKKGLSTRLWELLVLAVIGEQFNVGKEICGIVCSIRPQEDLISIWTKTANNQIITQRIKETMKKVLNLPQEYGTLNEDFFNTSIKMTKSFESPKLIWWIIIPTCIIYLFLMVHWPYLIPFKSLGLFGDLSYYLIANYRLLLLLILWSTFIAHFYEALIARRICRQLNINQELTYLWMIQTFIIGFPSLTILKRYTRRALW